MRKFFYYRLNRKKYLFYNILCFVTSIVLFEISSSSVNYTGLLFLIISISLTIRRLHDIGKSGWWSLVLLVPIVNIFYIIYLFVKSGENGRNKWNDNVSSRKKLSSNIPENVLNYWFDEMINQLTSGEKSSMFTSNVLLKKDEKLILDIPQVQYCEERTVKFKGTTQGVSVRLMKGVSYRFGGFEGGVEKKIVPLDYGNFTLTNKRLIFSGSTKSVEYPLSKIVTIDTLEDGIVINRSGKTKMEYFLKTTNISINITIKPKEGETFQEEIVEYRLTGIEVKKIIEQTIQKS